MHHISLKRFQRNIQAFQEEMSVSERDTLYVVPQPFLENRIYLLLEIMEIYFCQALCPFLCLCVCVSKILRKWTQTDTKVTFHPPPTTHPPPGNFFWSQMKGMAKIRLFYSGDMALILPR